MKTKNQHSKIILSENAGGAIAFCESCNVLELEVGPISLRIDTASLGLLSELINEAAVSMKTYKQERAIFRQAMQVFDLH